MLSSVFAPKIRPKVLFLSFALFLLLTVTHGSRTFAQESDSARLLALIDQARVNAGLAPLAVNPQLTAAAQAHAQDMAHNGVSIGHNGSDGSTPATRIVRQGYRTYSWGAYIGENWAAFRTLDESMNAWMSDQPHRGNILRPGYREIGIGIAISPNGAPILVTDFGAQPNTLPVFLSRSGPDATLTLTNEDAAPLGDGPNVIGQALSVEISSDANFSQAQGLPFSRTIHYSFPDGESSSTLYVRFHDALGRTAVSIAAPSALVISAASAPTNTSAQTPTPTLEPTRRATPIRPATPHLPSPTLVPTLTPSPQLTYSGMSIQFPLATSTASVTAILRLVRTPPAILGSVAAETVSEPILPPLSIWLFAAAGFLLLLAAAIAMRMRGR
jgi:uncharacterized protein YkwD